jgi:cytochrome c peroxidase
VFRIPAAYLIGFFLHFAPWDPPSLRGVSQGGPFFHDNRAASLEEVVTRFQHQLGEPLPPSEAADLIEYLKSR